MQIGKVIHYLLDGHTPEEDVAALIFPYFLKKELEMTMLIIEALVY
jgi:hypothetical protein